MAVTADTFREKYGPWAMVLGASEGMGAEFARRLAAEGLDLVLVARTRQKLEDLAEEIGKEHGVACRVQAIDLSMEDAAARVVGATRGLDVGFVVFNAGAVNHGTSFCDLPVEEWLAIVRRNNEVTVRLCHHFGSALRERGHGGLVLMSSGAGAAGAGRLAIYSATKAFDRNFGEALWAELSPKGVDVVSVVVPPTKTPALLRLLDEAGIAPPDAFAEPDQIVATVLAQLGDGPTLVFEQLGSALDEAAGAERRALVVGNTQAASGFFGQEGS